MQRLDKMIKVDGTGIPGLTATLIERTGNICIYERSDDVWEVFRVTVSPAEEVFGRSYPERETYPGNEDFGKTAWCFSNKQNALKKYRGLIGIPLNYARSPLEWTPTL